MTGEGPGVESNDVTVRNFVFVRQDADINKDTKLLVD